MCHWEAIINSLICSQISTWCHESLQLLGCLYLLLNREHLWNFQQKIPYYGKQNTHDDAGKMPYLVLKVCCVQDLSVLLSNKHKWDCTRESRHIDLMDSHVVHLPQIAQSRGTCIDDPNWKQFRNIKHAAGTNVHLTHVLNSYCITDSWVLIINQRWFQLPSESMWRFRIGKQSHIIDSVLRLIWFLWVDFELHNFFTLPLPHSLLFCHLLLFHDTSESNPLITPFMQCCCFTFVCWKSIICFFQRNVHNLS